MQHKHNSASLRFSIGQCLGIWSKVKKVLKKELQSKLTLVYSDVFPIKAECSHDPNIRLLHFMSSRNLIDSGWLATIKRITIKINKS